MNIIRSILISKKFNRRIDFEVIDFSKSKHRIALEESLMDLGLDIEDARQVVSEVEMATAKPLTAKATAQKKNPNQPKKADPQQSLDSQYVMLKGSNFSGEARYIKAGDDPATAQRYAKTPQGQYKPVPKEEENQEDIDPRGEPTDPRGDGAETPQQTEQPQGEEGKQQVEEPAQKVDDEPLPPDSSAIAAAAIDASKGSATAKLTLRNAPYDVQAVTGMPPENNIISKKDDFETFISDIKSAIKNRSKDGDAHNQYLAANTDMSAFYDYTNSDDFIENWDEWAAEIIEHGDSAKFDPSMQVKFDDFSHCQFVQVKKGQGVYKAVTYLNKDANENLANFRIGNEVSFGKDAMFDMNGAKAFDDFDFTESGGGNRVHVLFKVEGGEDGRIAASAVSYGENEGKDFDMKVHRSSNSGAIVSNVRQIETSDGQAFVEVTLSENTPMDDDSLAQRKQEFVNKHNTAEDVALEEGMRYQTELENFGSDKQYLQKEGDTLRDKAQKYLKDVQHVLTSDSFTVSIDFEPVDFTNENHLKTFLHSMYNHKIPSDVAQFYYNHLNEAKKDEEDLPDAEDYESVPGSTRSARSDTGKRYVRKGDDPNSPTTTKYVVRGKKFVKDTETTPELQQGISVKSTAKERENAPEETTAEKPQMAKPPVPRPLNFDTPEGIKYAYDRAESGDVSAELAVAEYEKKNKKKGDLRSDQRDAEYDEIVKRRKEKIRRQIEAAELRNEDEFGVPKNDVERPDLSESERSMVEASLDDVERIISGLDAEFATDEEKQRVYSVINKTKEGSFDDISKEEIETFRDFVSVKYSDGVGQFYIATTKKRDWSKKGGKNRVATRESSAKDRISGIQKFGEAVGLRFQPGTDGRTTSKQLAPTSVTSARTTFSAEPIKGENGINGVSIGGKEYKKMEIIPTEKELVKKLKEKGFSEKKAMNEARKTIIGYKRWNDQIEQIANAGDIDMVDFGDVTTHEGRATAINKASTAISKALERAMEDSVPPNPPLGEDHYALVDSIATIDNPLERTDWEDLEEAKQNELLDTFEQDLGGILEEIHNLGDLPTARAEFAEYITYMVKLSQGFASYLPASDTFPIGDVIALKQPEELDFDDLSNSIDRINVEFESGVRSVKFGSGAKSASKGKLENTRYKTNGTREILYSLEETYDDAYNSDTFPPSKESRGKMQSKIEDAISFAVKHNMMTETDIRNVKEKAFNVGMKAAESFVRKKKKELEQNGWTAQEIDDLKETMAIHCSAGNILQHINNADVEYTLFSNVKHKVLSRGYSKSVADGIDIIPGMNFNCDPGYNLSGKKVTPGNRNPTAITELSSK